MLNKEQNALITLTDAGTPGGELMRRYWQPVALSEELSADTPLPTRILGEDLVLFRDPTGQPRLIGRYCPHRGVDLSYGRLDKGGLRCIYHGWLMSGDGRCLEQPGEPAASDYKDKIRLPAYPCHEAGGLILTYMGPGRPPRIPALPFMACPAEQTWTTKIYHACNYLQGNEGNVDPQHLSFLHVAFGAQNSLDPGINDLIAGDVAPALDVEETAYGFRIFAIRHVGSDKKLVRITNFIMPNSSAFDGVPLFNPRKDSYQPNLGYQIHWHVPIDDGAHWKYAILYRYSGPIDREFVANDLLRRARQELSFAPQRAEPLPARPSGNDEQDICRRRAEFLRPGSARRRNAGAGHGSLPRASWHDRSPHHLDAPATAARGRGCSQWPRSFVCGAG